MGLQLGQSESIFSFHFTDAVRRAVRANMMKAGIRIPGVNPYSGYLTLASLGGAIFSQTVVGESNFSQIKYFRERSERLVLLSVEARLAYHGAPGAAVICDRESEVSLILCFAGNSEPEVDLALVLASAVNLEFIHKISAEEIAVSHGVMTEFSSLLK